MKKFIAIIMAMVLMLSLAACVEYEDNGSKQDVQATMKTASTLQEKQPTPTDIDYSLERYNLIRRAYWVNGQREKANTVICQVDKPLGYIVLFTESGGVVGRFIVDGKVSSLNSFLTPDSEYYEKDMDWSNGSGSERGVDRYSNKWLADVDGSYGENDNGIFFENPSIQAAIDQKFASEQKVVIQENENKAALAKAEAEAQALLIKTEAEGEAMKMLAADKAEAFRMMGQHLTEELLQKMFYDTWDGKLPTVYGADGTLLEIVP